MTQDMRTPLSRVRGFGSAKSGTEHFWHQRLTAIANLPLVIGFVVLIVCLVGEPRAVVVDTLSQPWVAIFLLLCIFSVTTHMRLGMQIIIEDYLHNEATKVLALMGNTFFCITVALAAAFAILKISFGI